MLRARLNSNLRNGGWCDMKTVGGGFLTRLGPPSSPTIVALLANVATEMACGIRRGRRERCRGGGRATASAHMAHRVEVFQRTCTTESCAWNASLVLCGSGFLRHDKGRAALARVNQGSGAPLTRPWPGYPLSGCSPA